MSNMDGNTIDELAGYVHTHVVAKGGATVSLYGFAPDDGFMVGGLVNEETWNIVSFNQEGGTQWVSDFIRAHEDLLSTPDVFVGAWLNVDTHTVHLDVSERFDTYGAARLFAMARDQLALFDLKHKRTVRI